MVMCYKTEIAFSLGSSLIPNIKGPSTVHIFKIDARIQNTVLTLHLCDNFAVNRKALLEKSEGSLRKSEVFFQRCRKLHPKNVRCRKSLTDVPEFFV